MLPIRVDDGTAGNEALGERQGVTVQRNQVRRKAGTVQGGGAQSGFEIVCLFTKCSMAAYPGTT